MIAQTTRQHTFHGYPVVTDKMILLGFVTREKVRVAVGMSFSFFFLRVSTHGLILPAAESLDVADSLESLSNRRISFHKNIESGATSMSNLLEVPEIQLKKEVPQELVVNMFQRLVCQVIFNPSYIDTNAENLPAEYALYLFHASWEANGHGDSV